VATKTLEHKRFSPELKLSDVEGVFRATIATLNVKDKDGDVTLPGFFGKQTVPILIGHDWGMIPVGKGQILEDGNKAVLEAKLNLEDANAKSAYEWLKFDFENGTPGQEFSYGYSLEEGGFKSGQFKGEDVRFLQPTKDGNPGAKIHEASLVLVGAGEGTGTQVVKTVLVPREGLKFSEHITAVLAAVSAFVERARSLADLRAKEDRTLSDDNLEKIRELRAGLDGILEGSTPEPDLELPSDDQFELTMSRARAQIDGRI
jgi:hypothetical protein